MDSNGNETGNDGNNDANAHVTPPANTASIQAQLDTMQQLMAQQMQLMQMQMQNTTNSASASLQQQQQQQQQQQSMQAQAVSAVKRVTIPSGRYNINSHELRTYSKDCNDFQKLTMCTDEQAVLQMRMNMDEALKQAVDANYSDTWDTFTVTQALKAIETLVKRTTNPVVFRKQFDGIVQTNTESMNEFFARLKICAADCDFICPFEPTHNLTEYHMVNRIRSGVADKKLQQELLQKSDQLNTLKLITEYCLNFETSQEDQKKLESDAGSIAAAQVVDSSSRGACSCCVIL